ncbi:uncharacterized protein LOC119673510 [Teleopsis dalmanni]|uniref:uncharacterized protein LOC119673510 n=1 Tax=Teleopsis dalmanni TaxID=139649 RepID=UPI0018CC8B5E|nr:uncharacterized protein LOC119673510 [Teleopsis dalmanni]
MKHLSLLCLIFLIRQISVETQYLPGDQHQTDSHYLNIREDGSYKYAFDTSNGIETEQSANENNEVTGQYSYFENNIPHKVKYTAGVNGFQPETFSAATAENSANYLKYYDAVSTASSAPYNLHNDYKKPVQGEPTYQFVQNALRTMQTQPVQLSFSSQHGFPQRFYNHEVNSKAENKPTLTLDALSLPLIEDQKFNAVAPKLSQHEPASNIDVSVNSINPVRPKTAIDLLSALSEYSPQLVVSMTNEPFGSYSYEVPAHHPNIASNFVKN